jgi:hypothetical protein
MESDRILQDLIADPAGTEFLAPPARSAAARGKSPTLSNIIDELAVAATRLSVNGKLVSVAVDDPDTPLLDVLKRAWPAWSAIWLRPGPVRRLHGPY